MNAIKKYLSQKPWKIATDLLFVILILMMLIPATRSVILSGVASVRSFILPISGKQAGEKLEDEDWNWQLTDYQGNTTSFSTLKGKVIFLNQWATWCPPCRAEMPSIEKFYKSFNKEVAFVIITNEDPSVVRNYLNKHMYSFPVYFGRVGGTKMISRTIPSTTIIGSAGEILVHKSGAYNWNSAKVRKLVKRNLELTGTK
jgi:thiol-disulfide isomerase/thioredoxin